MKIRRRPRVVVGLDLSLRAAAACSIPSDWNFDWKRVRTAVFGESLSINATARDHIKRMMRIASGVTKFCRDAGATSVFVESYAFGMRSSSSHGLAELGGVVKASLLSELGLSVDAVVASQARKTLLQRLPRKDIKKFVLRNARRLGEPVASWGDDEVDALVIANHALVLVGGIPLSFEGE